MASYAADLYEGIQIAESLRVPRGGLKYTNTSGQLRIPNGPTANNAYTFTSWVKITTDTNFYALWLSLQGSATTYWEAGWDITGTSAIVNDLSNERAVGINFTVGAWYFFGVSMGASGAVKVFIGTEGGSLTKYTTTLTALTLPLTEKLLGGELSYEALSGAMSETRFWNAVLSDAEFFTEFRSEVQARTSNAGGYWKLENPGSKFTDSSGNSNTLTAPTGTGTWAYEPGPRIDPAPSVNLFENIGMAEVLDVVHTPAGGTGYTANVNETVTVSEALGAVFGAIAGIGETVSLSEAASAVFAAIVAPAETVSLSEALAASMGTTAAVSENVGLSESLAALYGAIAGLAETVTISEAVAAVRGAIAALSETVSLSESLSATYAAVTALAETVTLSEALAAAQAMSAAIAETVTLAEAVVAGSANVANASETVTMSEALGVAYNAAVAVGELVTLLEALSVTMATSVALAEQIYVAQPAMPELASTDLHLVAEDWTPGQHWVSRRGGFTAFLHGVLQRQALGAIERNEIVGFSTSNYFSLTANAAHEFTPTLQATWEFLIRSTGSPSGGILMGRFSTPYAGAFDMAQYGAGVLLGAINTAGDDYYRLLVGDANFSAGIYHVAFVLDSIGDTLKSYVNGVLDTVVTGHTSTLVNSTPDAFFIGNSNGNDQPFDGGYVELLRHREALSDAQVAQRYMINRVQVSLGAHAGVAETVALAETLGVRADYAAALGEIIALAESLNVAVPTGVIVALIVELAEAAYTATLEEGSYTATLEANVLTPYAGTRVYLKATFKKPDGTLFDPTDLTLTIEDKNGTETPYTGAAITRLGLGVFKCEPLLTVAGRTKYKWRCADDGEEVVQEGRLLVLAPAV